MGRCGHVLVDDGFWLYVQPFGSYVNTVARRIVVAYIKKTPRVNKPRGSLPANRTGGSLHI